ncbi:ABC transporter substrate-binding protein [Mollicutes bacterium LVI A0039]|nr:ABC transporter substrate-binding protein [Mollicutes bacterium LVI A0039]
MKKIMALILVTALLLTGCSSKTYSTIALNFKQSGGDYKLVPDENAANYNQLITDLESLNIDLNSDTKVAVLSTSTANLLDNLGLNIVGVTSSKNLNDNLKEGLEDGTIVDLGSPISPNLEQLTSLDEEIIFVGSNMPVQEEYAALDNLVTLPQVFYYDIFYTVYGLISEFKLGDDAQAVFNQMVITDQMAKDIEKTYTDENPSAAVLKYAYGNFTIAPDNTYAGSLATEIKVENIYGDYTDVELPVDMEKLLLDDPQYIILYGKGDDMQADVDKLMEDPVFSSLTAAKEGRVVVLESISLNADIESADTLLQLSTDIYES